VEFINLPIMSGAAETRLDAANDLVALFAMADARRAVCDLGGKFCQLVAMLQVRFLCGSGRRVLTTTTTTTTTTHNNNTTQQAARHDPRATTLDVEQRSAAAVEWLPFNVAARLAARSLGHGATLHQVRKVDGTL
jgi:hypothetical protein